MPAASASSVSNISFSIAGICLCVVALFWESRVRADILDSALESPDMHSFMTSESTDDESSVKESPVSSCSLELMNVLSDSSLAFCSAQIVDPLLTLESSTSAAFFNSLTSCCVGTFPDICAFCG